MMIVIGHDGLLEERRVGGRDVRVEGRLRMTHGHRRNRRRRDPGHDATRGTADDSGIGGAGGGGGCSSSGGRAGHHRRRRRLRCAIILGRETAETSVHRTENFNRLQG